MNMGLASDKRTDKCKQVYEKIASLDVSNETKQAMWLAYLKERRENEKK